MSWLGSRGGYPSPQEIDNVRRLSKVFLSELRRVGQQYTTTNEKYARIQAEQAQRRLEADQRIRASRQATLDRVKAPGDLVEMYERIKKR